MHLCYVLSFSDGSFHNRSYVLVKHGWSNDTDSYASNSSLATGRACDARQVKGDDPD